MAPGGAVKVLLATGPRALPRSTLTAPPSAMMRRYGIACQGVLASKGRTKKIGNDGSLWQKRGVKKTTALPESHVPALFSHNFGHLIKCVLGGYDRLRFRGTLRPLFSPGLIGVLGAVEPCSAMTVRANRQTQRLAPVHEHRRCLHFYHYFEDPTFGRCHVRVQSWYPFTVDICLNGRAMLACQMDQHQLAYLKADNCFLELADPRAAQELADAQRRLDWVAHLNRLLALAHPVHRQVLVPLYRLEYYWTSTQSEYATDLVFKDPEQLAKLYPRFVQHGIMTFRASRVMRFLGHRVPIQSGKVNGRFKGALRSDRIERHEGVCLRRRAEVSRAANNRYLEALASTRGTEPLGAAVKQLCQPVQRHGYRFRGLNPLAAPDAALLGALSRGQWTINGFRNADLRKHLYLTRSRSAEVARRRSAAVSRKLRLLRAHGLIRKVPGSHRYLLTTEGRKLTTLLTAARNADVGQLTAFAA